VRNSANSLLSDSTSLSSFSIRSFDPLPLALHAGWRRSLARPRRSEDARTELFLTGLTFELYDDRIVTPS
jgi:hypothetical protein